MKKMLWLLFIGFCALSSAADAQENLKGSIQIKGSDTMVNLGQAWAEAFNKKYPAVSVAVTGGGSGTGFSALINGTCDIAETSRVIKDKEIALAQKSGLAPYELKVALDGLSVVVNPKNTVDKLTVSQLSDIFTGRIGNWKEVGGPDMAIVILSREVNSGTHIYFKEHVLRKGSEKSAEEFAPAALLMPSSQAIADEIAANVNAVGYYGMGYVSERQKAVAVARDESSEYVLPAIEDIRSDRYPISRPLLMYTRGQPQGVVKEFVDFVLSKEGQEIVAKVDFVPVK